MSVKTYSLKTDGETVLSANFRVKEFRCRDGSDQILISDELAALLQRIRDHFGRAVAINSAYRTRSHNTAIGGAPGSQHMLGTAADITISGVTPLEVAQYAEYLQPKAGGIGVYRSFTHVDVRTGRSRWDSRSGSEQVVLGWPGYEEHAPERPGPSVPEEPASAWYDGDRGWAIEKGLTDGSRPTEPATRAEVWAMLHRLSGG